MRTRRPVRRRGAFSLVGRRRFGGGEGREALRRASGPPRWGLRGCGASTVAVTGCQGSALALERVRAGRAQFPVVGPGGGSGSLEGLGAPSTGTVFGSSYYREGRSGRALPQGRQDGAGAVRAVPSAGRLRPRGREGAPVSL